MLKNISLGLGLFLSSLSAQAEHVALEDWWLTTDAFGGLKQSESAPEYYFAVSKTNAIDIYSGDTYETPEGYRIATSAEGVAAFTSNQNAGAYNLTYHNQGGWNGYSWEGSTRTKFLFSDSLSTNLYKHTGNRDDYKPQVTSHFTTQIAGFVLVKDVPVPLMFSALGLGLIGFSKRKKNGGI